LLSRYRADGAFAEVVQEQAAGLELVILDVSERGLILAPANRDSRFSLRMGDLRATPHQGTEGRPRARPSGHQRGVLSDTDRLEDDAKTPLPATVARFRDTLLSLVHRLAEAAPDDSGEPDAEEFIPGWQLLERLPAVNPRAERASTSSIDGFVKLALKQMTEYGLVRARTRQRR